MSVRRNVLIQHTFIPIGLIACAALFTTAFMWPREDLPKPEHVDLVREFGAAFLARAGRFRGTQAWIGVASWLTISLVPLALAWWWPPFLARIAGGRRWLPASAAASASAVAIALLVALPLSAWSFVRAREYGLSVQRTSDWAGDWLIELSLLCLAAAVAGVLATALSRRLPRTWWLPFAAALTSLAVLVQVASPLLLEPLFADFEPASAAVERQVTRLSRASGVEVGEVLVADASRRTTTANAYVSGLGATKRVVLYDTLLTGRARAGIGTVVAHEFAHVRHRDLARGLIWFGFVALAGAAAAHLMASGLARRHRVTIGSPAFGVFVLAAVLLATAIAQPAASSLSRRVEARADVYAMRLSGDAARMYETQRLLALQNLRHPRPPRLAQLLLGTHPTVAERMGRARAVARRDRGEPLR